MELLDLSDFDLRHILPFLDQKDVLALSKTCRRVNELCQSTSSLWRSFTVNLGQRNEMFQRRFKLTENEKETVEVSGDRIQNMDLSLYFGEDENFDELSLELLSNASRMWDLKKFSFNAFFEPVFSISFGNHIPMNCLSEPFIELVRNCLNSTHMRNKRIETLSFLAKSWQAHTDKYRTALLTVLRSATLCESVNSFSLDCFFSCFMLTPSRHYQRWYQRSCDYGQAIGKFKNLQKLDINSLYLTDSLFEALSQSGNVSLQSLTVVVDYFHEITAWPMLLKSCPSLEVTIEVNDQLILNSIYINIRHVIPAFVPVVSWKIYSFRNTKRCSRLWHSSMFDLLCFYSDTLKSLAIQTYSEFLTPHGLLKMVRICSKVQTLYLHCRDVDLSQLDVIKPWLILRLASLDRPWLKLGILEENIYFSPMFWNGSREENIARLCEMVSEEIGFEWKPELNMHSFYENIFTRQNIDYNRIGL